MPKVSFSRLSMKEVGYGLSTFSCKPVLQILLHLDIFSRSSTLNFRALLCLVRVVGGFKPVKSCLQQSSANHSIKLSFV